MTKRERDRKFRNTASKIGRQQAARIDGELARRRKKGGGLDKDQFRQKMMEDLHGE